MAFSQSYRFAFLFGLLEGMSHPAFLARDIFSLAFAVAIFMDHRNSDKKGKPGDGKCKACWMKQTL